MKIIAVIPARYNSTRFPGKPLAIINGKPMVWWVYNQAKKVDYFDNVYVATEDERIRKSCEDLGIDVIMTSANHLNGTERVSEVARLVKSDIYVTLQGDEPLVEPENINILIKSLIEDELIDCATLKTAYKNPVDVVNMTTPKVISDKNDDVILITRAAIPYPMNSLDFKYYKPTGQYAFRAKILELYAKLEPSSLEIIEGIELLRLIENGVKIKITDVISDTIAVDTTKDLVRVIDFLNQKRD